MMLAEFASADGLLAAIKKVREDGLTRLDLYSPYPIHGQDEALGLPPSRLPYYICAAGLLGAAAAYLLQWFVMAVDYPLNIGGRPQHTPLAFLPVTFEMGVLAASLTAVFGLLFASRLPMLWHPTFEVDGFERASIDRFWLVIDETDPKYDREKLEATLKELGALQVVIK